MHFGVTLVRVHPMAAPSIALKAEQLGYESVWIGDHLIWPAEFNPRYPYAPLGRPVSIRPDVPTMDCWVLLATIAAATATIRLGTDVYILPLRDPFVTARSAMTLDVLSGGRFTFGVGAGWLKEEFDVVGVDYSTRGRRTDECLRVLELLWTQDMPEFAGEFFQFPPVKFEPKPTQRAGPPILIGGQSPAALRRAAERADGWLGIGLKGPELEITIQRLRSLRRESRRAQEPLDITMLTNALPTAAEVDQFRQTGVTRLIVAPFERTKDAELGLERFAESAFR